jgi:hypothetical protein
MVAQFPDTVELVIPGTESFTDYDPAVTAETLVEYKADVQPVSSSLQVEIDGSQLIHKYDVFLPLSSDLSQVKSATEIIIESKRWKIMQVYPSKAIVALELMVGGQ